MSQKIKVFYNAWRTKIENTAQQFGVTVTFPDEDYSFMPEGKETDVRAFLDHLNQETTEQRLATFWQSLPGWEESKCYRVRPDGLEEYRRYYNGPWVVRQPGTNAPCERCGQSQGFYAHICIGVDPCPT